MSGALDVRALHGSEVLVLGAGVSGPGAVRVLAALGASVTVADSRPEALDTLRAGLPDGVDCETTDLDRAGELLAGGRFGLVITSPGWRPDSPMLVSAAEAGVRVAGDVELAWAADEAELFGPRRVWLAVTGTNGKTTCAAMLEQMCAAGGLAVRACGNIGLPVTEVLLAEPRIDVLACELSSFQLHWAPSVRPHAGLVLNIAEDHLDWHGSLDAYAAAKARVLDGGLAVADVDDAITRRLLSGAGAQRRVGFRAGEPGAGELGVRDGILTDAAFAEEPTPIIDAAEIRPPGPAGIADALGAAALALSVGVSRPAIAEGLRAFSPAAHRVELVDEVDGVRFVDDSKATNPHAARTSLLSADGVVWIAGGLLKGADVSELVAEVADRLTGVVLIGRDRGVIAASLARHAPMVTVVELPSGDDGATAGPEEPQHTMDRAVAEAAALANEGDTVLLAPSAASMDMFTDYGHRGRSFADAVRRLARSWR